MKYWFLIPFLDATHISLLFLSGLSKDSLNEVNSESFPVWIATTKVNYEAHRRNLIFYNRIDRSQYLYLKIPKVCIAGHSIAVKQKCNWNMNSTVIHGQYDTEENFGQNGKRLKFILQTGTSHIFLGLDIFQVLLLFYFHYLMILMTKREAKVRKGQDLIKELLQCYSVMVPITFIGASAYLDVMTRYLITANIQK